MQTNGSAAADPAPVAPERKLKRSIGLWMATALVVGNMIGSGIFLLPASLAAEAGPVSLLGWAGAMTFGWKGRLKDTPGAFLRMWSISRGN